MIYLNSREKGVNIEKIWSKVDATVWVPLRNGEMKEWYGSHDKILYIYTHITLWIIQAFDDVRVRILMGKKVFRRNVIRPNVREEYQDTNCRKCFETCAIHDIKPPTTAIDIRPGLLRGDQEFYGMNRRK